MKITFTLLVFLFTFLFSSEASAQTIFRSVASGNWEASSTWEISTDGGASWNPAASTPGSTADVLVRSGHLVTLTGSGRNCKNLTIEVNGRVRAVAGEYSLRINGTLLQNDGTLGGSSDAGDKVRLQLPANSTAGGFTVQGSGLTEISRMDLLGGGGTVTVTINKNITLRIGSNGVSTNYALSAVSTPVVGDNYTLIIAAGRTVTITGGYLHTSNSGNIAALGSYTYTINGTLDMSGSTTTGNSTIATSSDASKSFTINVNGTWKLPTSGVSTVNFSESVAAGQLAPFVFNVSGLLDGSAAPINNATTTIPPRLINTIGSGVVKRTVAANTISFPVSAGGSNNTVLLTNTGTSDDFSVRVKTTFDVAAPTTKIVNRQWNVDEQVAGGSVASVTFSWQTADQAVDFNPAAAVFIFRYNGATWDAYPATVSGTGTANDPYTATATGITAFSPFAVGNSTALPVSFLNFRAYTRSTAVQVEWSTASESNIARYVVEKSPDGQKFSEAGIVKATGNSNPIQNYSLLDQAPYSGNGFYRVRSVDFNGNEKISGIVRVKTGIASAELVIGSNPVRGKYLQLQLNGVTNGKYGLTLFSSNGQRVFSKDVVVEGSSFSQSISLPSVQAGVYTLYVVKDNIRLSKQIIIE